MNDDIYIWHCNAYHKTQTDEIGRPVTYFMSEYATTISNALSVFTTKLESDKGSEVVDWELARLVRIYKKRR